MIANEGAFSRAHGLPDAFRRTIIHCRPGADKAKLKFPSQVPMSG